MAEFQEVIQQKKRMCNSILCCKCDIYWLCGEDLSKCQQFINNNPKKAEEVIISWAAKHPEPMYPTWREWLIKIGGAVKKLYAQQYHYEAAQPTQLIEVVEVLDKPIPTDIAQKLGLQPKEN